LETVEEHWNLPKKSRNLKNDDTEASPFTQKIFREKHENSDNFLESQKFDA
jgi:hypothetical protein